MYKDENRNIFWSKFYMTARIVLIYVVLIALAFVCLFTMYVMVLNALRSNSSLMKGFSFRTGSFSTIAHNFHLAFVTKTTDKYACVNMLNVSLIKAFGNTILFAALSTFCTVYFSCVVAYGIHMYQFKLRNAAFTFILMIMMIPGQVSSTGFVSMCYEYGWNNYYFPLIIPSMAAPVTFFYVKQYMESVLPYEMVEAARVDGAGEIRIFHQIVLPVLKPALAVQVIFAFVGSWNNYFMPQLLIADANKTTMPLLISKLYSASNGSKDLGMINAVIFVGVVPLIVVYFIFSKFIIKGLTLGSVKG